MIKFDLLGVVVTETREKNVVNIMYVIVLAIIYYMVTNHIMFTIVLVFQLACS